MTVIEIRPHGNGWKVFETLGVEHKVSHFLELGFVVTVEPKWSLGRRVSFPRVFKRGRGSGNTLRMGFTYALSAMDLATVMKQKKIETHKIGLVGQAPSRRGDPRKPPAGPHGQKIARLAGMSYDELITCRRKHLNTHYNGKRSKGDAFDRAKGNAKAADVLMDWRVERIVLLGKNVARCFGFRDVPFLAEISIYGRRFLIFPHPSGINRWWNERRNERRARQLLQRFLRGDTVLGRGGRQVRPVRSRARSGY
jgi:hypothetical protein